MLPNSINNARIGLFGGSFNPPHIGHIAVSEEALKRLRLDLIIWLVSPANPLKNQKDYLKYDSRIKKAQEMTTNPRIIVSNFEEKYKCNYSYNTVRLIKTMHPGNKFIWIMGADCVVNMHLWHKWRSLLEEIPIAIFNRPNFILPAISSRAITAYKGKLISKESSQDIVKSSPPILTILDIPLKKESSTRLRNQANK